MESSEDLFVLAQCNTEPSIQQAAYQKGTMSVDALLNSPNRSPIRPLVHESSLVHPQKRSGQQKINDPKENTSVSPGSVPGFFGMATESDIASESIFKTPPIMMRQHAVMEADSSSQILYDAFATYRKYIQRNRNISCNILDDFNLPRSNLFEVNSETDTQEGLSSGHHALSGYSIADIVRKESEREKEKRRTELIEKTKMEMASGKDYSFLHYWELEPETSSNEPKVERERISEEALGNEKCLHVDENTTIEAESDATLIPIRPKRIKVAPKILKPDDFRLKTKSREKNIIVAAQEDLNMDKVDVDVYVDVDVDVIDEKDVVNLAESYRDADQASGFKFVRRTTKMAFRTEICSKPHRYRRHIGTYTDAWEAAKAHARVTFSIAM